jgi:hypothetical protein
LRGRDRLRASVQHASRQGDARPVGGGNTNAEDARSDRTMSGSLAVNYERVPFQHHSRTLPCLPAPVQADPSPSSEPRCRLHGFRVFALVVQCGAGMAPGAGQNAGAKEQGRTGRVPRASACRGAHAVAPLGLYSPTSSQRADLPDSARHSVRTARRATKRHCHQENPAEPRTQQKRAGARPNNAAPRST